MESKGKGKYVWDPDKQAWVKPGEQKGETAATSPAPARKAEPAPVTPEAPREAAEPKAEAKPQAEAVPATEEALEEEEELGLPYVGAGPRLVALFIDAVIYGFLAWIPTVWIPDDSAWMELLVALAFLVLYFGGLWAWRGQTLGKIVLRARVVRTDGEKIDPVRAFLRAIVFVVYYIPVYVLGAYFFGPGVGYVFVAAAILIILVLIARRGDKRAPHDLLLGTMVVSSQAAVEVEEEEA